MTSARKDVHANSLTADRSYSSGSKSGAVRNSAECLEGLATVTCILQLVFSDALYEDNLGISSGRTDLERSELLNSMIDKVKQQAQQPLSRHRKGEEEDEAQRRAQQQSQQDQKDSSTQLRVVRDEAWLRWCGDRMSQLIVTILPAARQSTHIRVRAEAARMASVLLVCCKLSLLETRTCALVRRRHINARPRSLLSLRRFTRATTRNFRS